jgi:hypothetical protein
MRIDHDLAVLRQVARAYLVLASWAAAGGAPVSSTELVARAASLIRYCARRERRRPRRRGLSELEAVVTAAPS